MKNTNYRKNLNRGKFLKNIFILVALLTFCFISSYIITDRLTNSKYIDELTNAEETQVYNSSKMLDDNVKIVLKENGTVVKEENIKSFKIANSITTEVSESFLINFFKSSGYNLESYLDEEIVFLKESSSVTLEPNKYYIGEKNGYFAIYKTDNNGRPFIEEAKDVYSNHKLVETIPSNDQQEILSFKHFYDTKEEAKEWLSGYIS